MLSEEKEGVSREHGAWWWFEHGDSHLAADTNGVVAGKCEFGLVVDLDRLEFVSVGVSSSHCQHTPRDRDAARFRACALDRVRDTRSIVRALQTMTYLSEDFVRPPGVVAQTCDTVPNVEVAVNGTRQLARYNINFQ